MASPSTSTPESTVHGTCIGCRREFVSAHAMALHYNASASCKGAMAAAVNAQLPTDLQVEPERIHVRRRQSKSYKWKAARINEVTALREAGNPSAVSFIASRYSLPPSTLKTWMGQKEYIFEMAKRCKVGKKKRYRPKVGKHHAAESILYLEFLYHRKVLLLRCGASWLRRHMTIIMRNTLGITDFETPSYGWAVRFRARWDITDQAVTNSSKQSIEERIPSIQKFHRFLHELRNSGPQRCPKYGRLTMEAYFHQDQVPLPLASSKNRRSLNPKGTRCQASVTRKSDLKRFCTLQVTICARADRQIVPLEIIFKKKTPFKGAEAKLYATLTNLVVRFQHSAWADERIMVDYIQDFRRHTVEAGLTEVLLGMDNHGSQQTDTCRAMMEYLDIIPAYTTANNTDCISPVDRNIGALIKNKIHDKYEAAYQENAGRWNLPSSFGGMSDPDRRMMLAQWASEAWADVCANHQHAITHAFVSTGFLLAKDGSEDHLIRLTDAKDPNDEVEYSY